MDGDNGRFCRGVFAALLSAAGMVWAAGVAAVDPGPQNTVRRFCEADARGARIFAGQWGGIAGLVAWPFDPAWDRVLFITGYRIGPPRTSEGDRVAVDVQYGVVGEATASGFDPGPHVESVTFVLEEDGTGRWRITAPLLPPHVFGHLLRADQVVEVMAQGRGGFVANSVLVQQLLRAAGWDVPYVPTSTLLSEDTYSEVSSPATGDLVVYVQDGVPYHVGVLEAPGRLVSSTLNAGIVRTSLNAFLGEVHYRRLARVARLPAAIPTADVGEP